MPHQTRKNPAAQAYARSLLELANEQHSAETVARELDVLRQILRDSPSFRLYLADPAIGTIERREALERIFRGRLSALVANFIGVVNDHARLDILDQIIDAYNDLLDEQLGKIEVDVYVAQKLTSEQIEQVRRRISASLRKDAVVRQHVDDSLIGGLVLRVGDRLIDASARYQLQALREKMLAAPVPERV